MEKIYIISLETNGSGADFLTQSINERDATYKEYFQYLVDNRLAGSVIIREDIVDYKIVKNDSQCYFDTLDWDKTTVLHQKEYHPHMMKSKAELQRQIQRIYAVHKDHRLYNKALSLVMLYSHNMSMTAENELFWKNWKQNSIDPDNKGRAVYWENRLHTQPYHRNLYTARTK